MHESFNEKYEYISEKYIWKNELKDEYINRLSQESTKVQFELLDSKLSHCSNGTEVHITKTRLYKFDPLKPHFYIVKLGLQGYTLFFLFLL